MSRQQLLISIWFPPELTVYPKGRSCERLLSASDEPRSSHVSRASPIRVNLRGCGKVEAKAFRHR